MDKDISFNVFTNATITFEHVVGINFLLNGFQQCYCYYLARRRRQRSVELPPSISQSP